MKLKRNKKQEGKTEQRELETTEEFVTYQRSLATQGEQAARIRGYQARLNTLTAQASSLREQLDIARNEKKDATERRALGEIGDAEYEAVKQKIARLTDLLDENTEQASILKREIARLSRETLAASQAVQGARFNMINAHISREASDIKTLIGEDRLTKLVCLAAQLGITDYSQQLVKVFGPAPDFTVRQSMYHEALADVFGQE